MGGHNSTTTTVYLTTQAVQQLSLSQQPTVSKLSYVIFRSEQLQKQGFCTEVADKIAAPQSASARTIMYIVMHREFDGLQTI